ncbi:MAG: hypothetical protein DMD91_04880 [Candidatus Rokuibacteriota bacterium]|nr:MAG: hypothetical protein DMD91_04880 [Candidatus Rokubacteria bacterium]
MHHALAGAQVRDGDEPGGDYTVCVNLQQGPSCPTSVSQDWTAVILAGGDGTRLRELTRRIVGDDRPKQFCRILGSETLLDQTRQRVAQVLPVTGVDWSDLGSLERVRSTRGGVERSLVTA